jgi:hypothetical protein
VGYEKFVIGIQPFQTFAHQSIQVAINTEPHSSTMKKILTLIALAGSTLFSAHGALIYTTFNIPAGSSNVGSFSISSSTLYSTSDLSTPGPRPYPYAFRYFTPSVTGTYTVGMTNASYDPVMIIYSGLTGFPVSSPGAGALAFNDDGDWGGDDPFVSPSFGTQVVNPGAAGGAPFRMPLIKNLSLTSGVNYLVAISQYNTSSDPFPLPAAFFVAGAGAVAVDGVSGGDPAAVPEPGQVAASLLLLAGIGGYVFLKRRKAAKAAVPAVA